jgi:4-diphosphocytidyl-2-C-methyl-D-erythritol kinase
MHETAFAVNLALHVRARRQDGYHELETAFAFVDAGDELAVGPAAQDGLRVVGEFGGELADPFGNIVAKALTTLPRPSGWASRWKSGCRWRPGWAAVRPMPGAVFRLVERRRACRQTGMRAPPLGADVPACVESRACIGRGTGTDLEPADDDDLAGCPVLLVNPRIPLATGPVFKGWDGIDRGPLPEATAHDCARGRNDLEAPALALVPQIGDVLAPCAKPAPGWCACPALARRALRFMMMPPRATERRRPCRRPGGRWPGAAMNHEAWTLLGTPTAGGVLVVSDHASARVPEDIALGIDPALLTQHVAIDIGVAEIGALLAQVPGVAAFLGGEPSRLRLQPRCRCGRRGAAGQRWPCHSRQCTGRGRTGRAAGAFLRSLPHCAGAGAVRL